MAKRKSNNQHADRIKALRTAMSDAGVDTLIVTNPIDVAYLTGFLGGDSYMVVGLSGKPWIISDFRYEEELEPQHDLCKVGMRTGSIWDATAKAIAMGTEPKAVGYQGEHLTISGLNHTKHAFKAHKLKTSLLTPTFNLVTTLRETKDTSEIRSTSAAIKIQEEALEATLPQIKFGMTELEVCAILEYEMKVRGSTKPAFTTIVAAQANGSLPHYRPAHATVKRGQPLLIDWGALHNGYHGDMTRTFCFGRWPAELKEIYKIVLDAQMASADALAPGKSTREIDDIARGIIKKAGYGDHFGHGLGHSMGLEVHENPRLSNMTGEVIIKPGMIFTVEPGIYIPGLGGVRIEDDYVVTERGRRNLSSLPKDLAFASR